MMKALNEYELTKERDDELFGFAASCFVRNGIVWNEYYVIYRGLPLTQINDIFYISEEEAISTYSNLPLTYINGEIKTNINTYLMYTPKYKSEPHIIDSESFTCNINKDMEVEAIHLVNDYGDLIDVDVTIDHDNNIIYVTTDIGRATILYFDDKRRICKSELSIDDNVECLCKTEYDDENLESTETLTGGPDFDDSILSLIHTKYDANGRKLYMLSNDKTRDTSIISSIARRINIGEDAYIEFTKFKID